MSFSLRRSSPSCCVTLSTPWSSSPSSSSTGRSGSSRKGERKSRSRPFARCSPRESSVLRDGRRLTVPAESLVVGDVVLTEAGDRIPADLRLLRATSLKIEEAVLTGEAAAADKSVDPVAPDAALGDRASMAYSGTHGRERARRGAGGRDRRRDRAWPHQRHGRRRRNADHAAPASDERFRPAPDDRHSGARRLRLRLCFHGARLRNRACVHGRGRGRRIRDSRRPARGDDDHARHRRQADGGSQRHHSQPSCGRDAWERCRRSARTRLARSP